MLLNNESNVELPMSRCDYAPHDESLHSTLFRVLLSYDPNAKPIGIINKDGLWRCAPFIHRGYEHVFYRYPDHLLLEIIDIDLSLNGKGNSLFDHPANYTYKIEDTFFNGNSRNVVSRSIKSKKVRYCLSCIQESIESLGYGYFRHFWDRSTFCLIHERPLKELPALGFNNTVKEIRRILSGRDCNKAYYIDSNDEKFSSESRGDASNDMFVKYFFPIKFMFCLQEKFASWVRENTGNFTNSELSHLASKLKWIYLQECLDLTEFNYRRVFAYIYLLCSVFESRLLKQFYENNVELIRLELGPRKQNVLREIIGKNKSINCNSCNEKNCFLRNNSATTSLKLSELDFKFLLNNSYSLARLVMQGSKIASIGDDVWSPIDIYANTAENAAFEIYDLLLGADDL